MSNFTTPNTKQELRERALVAGAINEVFEEYTHKVSKDDYRKMIDTILQLKADTVNKVLDELASKAVNAQTYAQEDGSQYGTSHSFRAIPLSAIEQVRKEFNDE